MSNEDKKSLFVQKDEGLQGNEKTSVTEEEAIVLAQQLRIFLSEILKIPMGKFFSVVNRESFSGKLIPVLNSDRSESETENLARHYYVYWSYAALFPETVSPTHHHYDSAEEAKAAHQANLARGYDSLLEGVTANAEEEDNQTIHEGLFSPDLFYGLMTMAHEPLHPWLKAADGHYLHGYDFEEALVTYLGYEVTTLFFRTNPDTELMARKHEASVAGLMNKYSFLLKAYVSLKTLYSQGNNGLSRNDEQQKLMDDLKVEFGAFYADQKLRQEMMDEFNNAFLMRTINYTGVVTIKSYFETQSVDLKRFFVDSEYRETILNELQIYFDEHHRKVISVGDN